MIFHYLWKQFRTIYYLNSGLKCTLADWTAVHFWFYKNSAICFFPKLFLAKNTDPGARGKQMLTDGRLENKRLECEAYFFNLLIVNFFSFFFLDNFWSLRTYYFYRRPIGDPSETHWRPTCLIGDLSETDMPRQRPIEDQHASSETHRRPTCLIGDRHAS